MVLRPDAIFLVAKPDIICCPLFSWTLVVAGRLHVTVTVPVEDSGTLDQYIPKLTVVVLTEQLANLAPAALALAGKHNTAANTHEYMI